MMLRFCNVFRPFSHSSNLDVILNHGWNSKTKGIRRKENPFFLTRKGRVKEDISLFLLPGRVMPRDDFRHQRRDIDPRGFHLVDRARRDERGIRPGHEEHHVHPRPGEAVRRGELEFVFEIRDGPQPADDVMAAVAQAVIDGEAVGRVHGHAVHVLDRLFHHREPLLDGKDAFLARVDREQEDDAVKDLEAAAQNVHVPIRDGVE